MELNLLDKELYNFPEHISEKLIQLKVSTGIGLIYLESIAVSPEFRGFGIGTQVIDHLKKLSIKYNCLLFLYPANNNAQKYSKLVSFYTKRGFTPISEPFGCIRFQINYSGKDDNSLTSIPIHIARNYLKPHEIV